MKRIICEKVARIIKARRKLQARLNVEISNRGKEVYLDGDAEDEYVAEKVIDALNFGFSYATAIKIKEEDYVFEILNIKDYTRRKDLKSIKARIIGTGGGTLSTLHQLTKCHFELNGNDVGIICDAEHLENGQEAIISIIGGAKQGNVYGFLEKHQIKPVYDLGLKEDKSKE